MSRLTKHTLLILPVLLLASALMALFPQKSVGAVSASEWKAGKIIEDGLFYDAGSMSTSDIQNFLNSKVPTCDTNGTKIYSGSQTRAQYGTSRGYPPPYTCLKNYTQDGLSAAQIIKNASTTYNISPKTLLVLLQKEQTLVTDDWPWSSQYRSATGYGCPDTAPCDAEYYGFANQVTKAAFQFRRYATYPDQYRYKPYQNNTIQYNPSSSCGSSTVYIQNLATAGLYNYTPYQPNASALNNLYGSGDSCGAYGNRNFWRLFNDWFGSTTNGRNLSVIYKGQNSNELYAVWNGYKYYIPTYDMMIAWGIHKQGVNVVSDQTMAEFTTGPELTSIAKMSDNPDSPLYLFDDGKRYPIPGNACGYNLDGTPNPTTTWGLDCLNTNVSKAYPTAFIDNSTVQDITLPNMIAYQDSVWKLEGGKKRRIVDGLVIDVLGGWGNIRWMKDSNAQQPLGKILMRNGYAVRFTGSSLVYLYDNGQLYPVPSYEAFINWSLHKDLHDIPGAFNAPDPLPIGSNLTQVAKDSGNNFYLVDKGYKLPLANDTAQWPTDAATSAPGMLPSLPSIPLSNVYLSDSSGQIFTVYDKKRYVFPTMDDFFRLGFNPAAIRRVSYSIENLPGLTYGGMHMSNGRLFKVSNNPHQIYRVNGSTSQMVNSINYPGLEYDKLITVDIMTANRYPVAGTYTP